MKLRPRSFNKYEPSLPLIEFDLRLVEILQPGKGGMEGFSGVGKAYYERSLFMYVTVFRRLFVLELVYWYSTNKFAIRKRLRELLKSYDDVE